MTTSLYTRLTSRASFTPKWCPALNITLTIALCAANLSCASNPNQKRKPPPPTKKFNLNKLQSAEVKLTFMLAYCPSLKEWLPKKHFSWNTLGSPEECHLADIWRGSRFYDQEEQRLVRREQPRDSGTASEKEIISPSPPGSAIMFCEEGCLPSHLRHPPTQASRDPKISDGPISQREFRNKQTYVTTESSIKPSRQCLVRLTGSRVPCAVQMGKCFLQTRPPFWVLVWVLPIPL